MAQVGDVFETRSPETPWKIVFHTVATDEFYHTQPETVSAILRKCNRRCVDLQSIKSVITSPIGAGYGDLDLDRFVGIANQVCEEYEKSSIQSFAIVCRDLDEFEHLTEAARAIENASGARNCTWQEVGRDDTPSGYDSDSDIRLR